MPIPRQRHKGIGQYQQNYSEDDLFHSRS
jgi:hypothetical protein